MNKGGLSGVVTTVLIILLVVVAVAAVWAFISPTIKNTGNSVDKGQVCINNQIEVLNCVKINSSSNPGYNIAYRVRLNGDSVQKVNNSVVALEFGDGSVESNADSRTMENGASLSYSFLTSKIAKSAVVSVNYLLKDGDFKSCDSVEFDCSGVSGSAGTGSGGTGGGGESGVCFSPDPMCFEEDCDGLGQEACSLNSHCAFDSDAWECKNNQVCSNLIYQGESSCEAEGCTWFDPCASIQDKSTCSSTTGCSWA